MQHQIPVERLGAQGPAMVRAVETCIHCGLCLPACPTYLVLAEEMDSPRGRIFLMKDLLEGRLESSEESLLFIDRCLGCLACVSVCPSGVHYGELVAPFRAQANRRRVRPLGERLLRRLTLATLPYPGRFRLAARVGVLARPVLSLYPGRLRAIADLLPRTLPEAPPLPHVFPAQGRRRARVALLAGCVQQVLSPEINWATLRVLSRNGVEVVVPRGQGCCGALSLHAGEADQARTLARRNLKVFPQDVDAVVTNAAGCGSGMKEYGLLFAGEADEAEVRALAARVRDVAEFLDTLGVAASGALPRPARVAYHDACHLAHAQGIRAAPRRLLAAIDHLQLVEIPESDVCCGSAGTYNLEQPEIARALQERKVTAILSTEANAVATGNIGCLVQIRVGLQRHGAPVRAYHTMELLDQAYG